MQGCGAELIELEEMQKAIDQTRRGSATRIQQGTEMFSQLEENKAIMKGANDFIDQSEEVQTANKQIKSIGDQKQAATKQYNDDMKKPIFQNEFTDFKKAQISGQIEDTETFQVFLQNKRNKHVKQLEWMDNRVERTSLAEYTKKHPVGNVLMSALTLLSSWANPLVIPRIIQESLVRSGVKLDFLTSRVKKSFEKN